MFIYQKAGFFELFDDISLVLNVKRLCMVVDRLIRAAKVWLNYFWMMLTGRTQVGGFVVDRSQLLQ